MFLLDKGPYSDTLYSPLNEILKVCLREDSEVGDQNTLDQYIQ